MTTKDDDGACLFKARASLLAGQRLVLLTRFEDGELLAVVSGDPEELSRPLQSLARELGVTLAVLSGESYRDLQQRERDLSWDILGRGTVL